MDTELLEMMTEVVTWEAFQATLQNGRPLHYNAVQVPARIEQFSVVVADQQGRQVTSNTRAFLATHDVNGVPLARPVTVNDKITLPADYVPQSPPIISVQRELDEDGIVDHWKVAL